MNTMSLREIGNEIWRGPVTSDQEWDSRRNRIRQAIIKLQLDPEHRVGTTDHYDVTDVPRIKTEIHLSIAKAKGGGKKRQRFDGPPPTLRMATMAHD